MLGILAFLAYLLWAALGVFVCLAATLLGLIVVAIMFVLTVILIAILFVLGVFLIAFVILLAIAVVLLVMCLGTAITAALFCLAWMVPMAISAFCAKRVLQFAFNRAKDTKPPDNHAKGICYWPATCFGLLCIFITSYVGFLLDVEISSTAYVAFAGVCGSRCDGSSMLSEAGKTFSGFWLQAVAHEGFTDAVEGIRSGVYYVWTLSIWLSDRCNIICPGGAAIFAVSQMLMGMLVMGYIRHSRSVLRNMTILAIVTQQGKLHVKVMGGAAKLVIMKLLETIIVSQTFVLLFIPHKEAECNFEGDVIVAVFSYIVMIASSFVCLVFIPYIAFGDAKQEAEEEDESSGLENYANLFVATFGIVTAGARDIVMQDYHDCGLTNCEDEFLTLSLEFAAITYQILPFGGVISKCMMACNEGFILKQDKSEQLCTTILKQDIYAKTGKIIGFIKALIFIFGPLAPEKVKIGILIFTVPLIALAVLCEAMQDPPTASVTELLQTQKAPPRTLRRGLSMAGAQSSPGGAASGREDKTAPAQAEPGASQDEPARAAAPQLRRAMSYGPRPGMAGQPLGKPKSMHDLDEAE